MNGRIDRRRQILDAALAMFLARGYATTTIADIRAASGASTGSIYHLFPGKAAIAQALFTEAVAGWSDATRRATAGEGAEAEIRASVGGLFDWGLAHPDLFRALDEMRFLAPLIGDSPALAGQLNQGQAAARAIYDGHASAGRVRALPWAVARALILGPVYEFLRAVAAGAPVGDPLLARRLLGDAAWAAVRI